MKRSLDKLNQVSNLSASEIYKLECLMWKKQGKGVIDPLDIFDNQVKQGVIKHLNEKYGTI